MIPGVPRGQERLQLVLQKRVHQRFDDEALALDQVDVRLRVVRVLLLELRGAEERDQGCVLLLALANHRDISGHENLEEELLAGHDTAVQVVRQKLHLNRLQLLEFEAPEEVRGAKQPLLARELLLRWVVGDRVAHLKKRALRDVEELLGLFVGGGFSVCLETGVLRVRLRVLRVEDRLRDLGSSPAVLDCLGLIQRKLLLRVLGIRAEGLDRGVVVELVQCMEVREDHGFLDGGDLLLGDALLLDLVGELLLAGVVLDFFGGRTLLEGGSDELVLVEVVVRHGGLPETWDILGGLLLDPVEVLSDGGDVLGVQLVDSPLLVVSEGAFLLREVPAARLPARGWEVQARIAGDWVGLKLPLGIDLGVEHISVIIREGGVLRGVSGVSGRVLIRLVVLVREKPVLEERGFFTAIAVIEILLELLFIDGLEEIELVLLWVQELLVVEVEAEVLVALRVEDGELVVAEVELLLEELVLQVVVLAHHLETDVEEIQLGLNARVFALDGEVHLLELPLKRLLFPEELFLLQLEPGGFGERVDQVLGGDGLLVGGQEFIASVEDGAILTLGDGDKFFFDILF